MVAVLELLEKYPLWSPVFNVAKHLHRVTYTLLQTYSKNVPKFSPKMEIVFEMEGLNPSTNYALATHENGYQQSKNFHTTIGWSIQHI